MPAVDVLMEAEDWIPYLPGLLGSQGVTMLFGVLIAPITIGSYAFFMQLSRGSKQKVSDLFLWFGDFSLMGKAIGATVWYLVLILLWMLAFLAIPLAILFLLILFPNKILISMLVYPLIFVSGICILAAEIKAYSYTPALYLLAVNPALGVFNAFRNAKQIMRGHVWEFFVLQLSFLLWHLLASLTCGLSVLYVTPYVTLTNCYFINHLIGNYHKKHNIPIDGSERVDPDSTNHDDVIKF